MKSLIETRKTQDLGVSARVYREIDMLVKKLPISIQHFDRIIAEVERSLKEAYLDATTGDAERKNSEQHILTRAEIPPILTQRVVSLLFPVLGSLKEEIDEAELYFMDLSHLALTNDNYSKRRVKENPVDVITKRPMNKSSKVKRCPRCCSLSEDTSLQRSGNIIMALARQCVCGMLWMALDREDLHGTQLP